MDTLITQLHCAAVKAANQAYCPYSQFSVGVSLCTPLGNIYIGCNVENAAYGDTLCAECGAISSMVCAGEREITHVCVVSLNVDVCPPCGSCRQKLSEFGRVDTQVLLGSTQGIVKTSTLGDLLPESFNMQHVATNSPGSS